MSTMVKFTVVTVASTGMMVLIWNVVTMAIVAIMATDHTKAILDTTVLMFTATQVKFINFSPLNLQAIFKLLSNVNSRLLSSKIPVSIIQNDHETNTCQANFVLFHTDVGFLELLPNQHCKPVDDVSPMLTNVFVQKNSGGTHRQINNHVLHMNYLMFRNKSEVKDTHQDRKCQCLWPRAFPFNCRRSERPRATK